LVFDFIEELSGKGAGGQEMICTAWKIHIQHQKCPAPKIYRLSAESTFEFEEINYVCVRFIDDSCAKFMANAAHFAF
jgi:hypothetical protein